MRTTTIVYACIALFLLQACGISAEEKRNIEQAAIDRKAAQDSVQVLLVRMDDSRQEGEAALAMTKAELEAAHVSLERVKGWQFGRSRAEREQQIVSASFKVQSLETTIAELEKLLTAIDAEKARTMANAEYVAKWMQTLEASQ